MPHVHDNSDAMFERNVNKGDQQVISVDRNCLQCSGNKNQMLHQLKLACLSYIHSPIPYQDKNYHVTELLRIKA